MLRNVLTLFALSIFACAVGCQTSPETPEKKATLENDVQTAMTNFKNADPSLNDVLAKSVGWAIFPTAGKGGLIVGGGGGHGAVYQNPGGTLIGYATIAQVTVGAQIGGQEFAQLMVFETQAALDRFKANEFQFSADASAIAIESGAASAAKPKEGVITFIKPEKGLMAGAVIGGQKFKFQSTADAAKAGSTQTETKTETKTETETK